MLGGKKWRGIAFGSESYSPLAKHIGLIVLSISVLNIHRTCALVLVVRVHLAPRVGGGDKEWGGYIYKPFLVACS